MLFMEIELTKEEIKIMLHMIGYDNIQKHRRKKYLKTGDYYRNRFIAGDGHDDNPILFSLMEKGVVERFEYPLCNDAVSWCYWLNESGLQFIKNYQI